MFKNLFHVMTFTSALCALIEAAGDFPKRLSQIAIFPSTEHEANTKGSVGLHCIESKKKKKTKIIILRVGCLTKSSLSCNIPVNLQHYQYVQQKDYYLYSMLNQMLAPINGYYSCSPLLSECEINNKKIYKVLQELPKHDSMLLKSISQYLTQAFQQQEDSSL